MKKVVFDTNVWVSAFGFQGRVRSILDPGHHGKFEVAVSPAILEEAARVLGGPKFRFPPGAVAAVEGAIRKLARVVRPTEQLEVVKADPDDDPVLECAVESGAEIIVSGDRHLLDLGAFRGIRILGPAEFLDELEREEGPGTEDVPAAREAPSAYRVGRAPRTKAGKGKPKGGRGGSRD